MSKRFLFVALAAGSIVVTVAAGAGAVEPAEAAAVARADGYYIDPGLSVSESSISESVSRAANAGSRFFVVLLEADPPGGATTFAAAVRDEIGSGTVLVLSAGQEGIDSDEFDQSILDRALDAGYSTGEGDAAYVAAVVDTLVGAPGGTADSSTGGGSGGLLILLAIVAGLVLIVVFVVRRQRKSAAAAAERSVDEARAEIKGQIDAMANTILEISDQVSLSESREDNQYLEQAGATFQAAGDEFEGARDLRSLEALSDRLDEARWQLDAATAISTGKPVPPRPEKKERHVCFFDPTHRDATEEAEIRTPAGTQKVRVCREDAEKLRRGREPQPRMIQVGGRRLPAPMAPRSYGGSGLDWLDVFSVAVGGTAASQQYRWGGQGRAGALGATGGAGASASRTRSRTGRTRVRTGRTRGRRR
ncbi:MAG TPA: DUF6676 family protein [Gemmatimonadales bacterium]|nr:DUF6676 family protein [Gemmatimonadales bacterium]